MSDEKRSHRVLRSTENPPEIAWLEARCSCGHPRAMHRGSSASGACDVYNHEHGRPCGCSGFKEGST